MRALFFLFLSVLSCTAYADIGKIGGIGAIGSPVVPSNMPKPPPPPAAATGPASAENKDRVPLLVISFNQKRVNFDRALTQAVAVNEKSAPGTVYEIVAMIPNTSGSAVQATRVNETYAANLAAVMDRLQEAGISPDRIRTSTSYKDDVVGEDIYIYGK